MTVGDTLIAFGLLAIIVIITCEACWRARVPRWPDRNAGEPFRNALGGASHHSAEGQHGK